MSEETALDVGIQIDAALGRLPDDKRQALQNLRNVMRAAAPSAVEAFSYSQPAFRYRGRPLVSYGASPSTCAFYPMSPAVIESYASQLADYDTSKGTIRFTPDCPLPAALVTALGGSAPGGDRRAMGFRAIVVQSGKTTTGVPIPAEVMTALGAGKKPAVRVTVNGHTYRSSVATVDGGPMVSLSADNRATAGVSVGREVEVDIALDTAPREVDVPPELASALELETAVRDFVESLS